MTRSAALDEIRACLDAGAPWTASDLFRAAVAAGHDDAETNYWGALAYARAGAVGLADKLLRRVLAAGGPPSLRREALSLSGRLWKDRATRGGPSATIDAAAIARSHADYAAAYAIDGDPYPGINAATTARLAGRVDEARRLAASIAATIAARPLPRDAWFEASLGEALLLLDRAGDARDAFARVAAMTQDAFGVVASIRAQLALLGREIPEAAAIRDALPAPVVAAFAGHMIDRSDRAEPRFPGWLEAAVADALRAIVARWRKPIVYASAACGADLLFVEAALDAGAEVNIVLPFDREDFVATSVAFAGDRWVTRFDAALARASRVVFATEERYLGDDLLFEHAQRLVHGLAALRARQLQTEPTMLCVLDAEAPALIGGTRSESERWRRRGAKIEIVDLAEIRNRTPRSPEPATTVADAAPAADWTARPRRTLKTMLFADMAGFSRVHDLHAPVFHQRFLRAVAEQIDACAAPPLEANTWGDALYLVFDDAADGAAFAVGLTDRMGSVDWADAGMDSGSGVRVALHAGPVFCGFDPIIGRDNYFGTGTTTAARIEPITPPGAVYASEAFAATLATTGSTAFVCEYVGELALAKHYGTSRIHRVERR